MKKTILTLGLLSLISISAQAATVVLNFKANIVTGGTLNITTTGAGAVNDFTGDRFDEQVSSTLEVQSIVGVGTLGITATALQDDLNVTGSGLQDGSSGYNAAGEGTSFMFSRDVTITSLDWGLFTTDSVELLNNNISLGSFTTGDVSSGIDFTSTNPSTMSISVAAGNPFTVKYSSGSFYLESMGFNVVPEPTVFSLASFAGFSLLLRRRRA